VDVLFICSNTPAPPAYGVYISQLIRYYRACGPYDDFLDIRVAANKEARFLVVKLKSSTKKFYACHHDLVNRYRVSMSQINTNIFHLS
jgi:hypothetical protein